MEIHAAVADGTSGTRRTICILPIGSLERHGEHIPYGCDAGIAETLAIEAAKLAPAVIFPTYYFGQVHEAAMHRGAVNFPSEMLVAHIRILLDQISYNGFKKILIISGHGGNRLWLQFLEKTLIDYERTYCLYIVEPDSVLNSEEQQKLGEIYETKDGHAGETETSLCMAAMPGYVNLTKQYFPEPIQRMGKMDGLKGILQDIILMQTGRKKGLVELHHWLPRKREKKH